MTWLMPSPLACDLQTFMDLALRQLTASQALKDRRVNVLHGTRTSLTELFRVLAYTAPSTGRKE